MSETYWLASEKRQWEERQKACRLRRKQWGYTLSECSDSGQSGDCYECEADMHEACEVTREEYLQHCKDFPS